MDLADERLGNLRSGDDRGERHAVADALGHRHDVGDHALRLESPEMRAGAAKTGLHLVRNAHAAGGADIFVRLLEITLRKFHKATDTLNGFGYEPGDFARRRKIDHVLYVVGVFLARLRVIVSERSAIRI